MKCIQYSIFDYNENILLKNKNLIYYKSTIMGGKNQNFKY